MIKTPTGALTQHAAGPPDVGEEVSHRDAQCTIPPSTSLGQLELLRRPFYNWTLLLCTRLRPNLCQKAGSSLSRCTGLGSAFAANQRHSSTSKWVGKSPTHASTRGGNPQRFELGKSPDDEMRR